MFNKSLLLTALACVLSLGMAASAKAAGDRDDRPGHGRSHNGHPAQGPGWKESRGPGRGDAHAYRPAPQGGYRAPPRHDVRHVPPYAAIRPAPPPMYRHPMPPYMTRQLPPPYGWVRGMDYRRGYGGPVYVVNDYHRYDLRHPPRGHRWIRDDHGNYLLVAIATGIIADLLLHH